MWVHHRPVPVLACTGRQGIVQSYVVGASSTLAVLSCTGRKDTEWCCWCIVDSNPFLPATRSCLHRKERYMSCVVGAVPYFFSIDPYPFLLAQERKELLELCCGCIIEPYPFLPAACSCLYRTAKYSYELCCGCIVDSTVLAWTGRKDIWVVLQVQFQTSSASTRTRSCLYRKAR